MNLIYKKGFRSENEVVLFAQAQTVEGAWEEIQEFTTDHQEAPGVTCEITTQEHLYLYWSHRAIPD